MTRLPGTPPRARLRLCRALEARRPSALRLPCGASRRRCLLIPRPSSPPARPPPHFKVCAAVPLRRRPGGVRPCPAAPDIEGPRLTRRRRPRREVGGRPPRSRGTETLLVDFSQAGRGPSSVSSGCFGAGRSPETEQRGYPVGVDHRTNPGLGLAGEAGTSQFQGS